MNAPNTADSRATRPRARSAARLIATGFALAALLLGGIVLARWIRRPLFATSFHTRELSLLPAWHYTPRYDDAGGILMCDGPNNQILIATSKGNAQWSCAVGTPDRAALISRDDSAEAGIVVIIARRAPSRITVIRPNHVLASAPLAPGDAQRIDAWVATRLNAQPGTAETLAAMVDAADFPIRLTEASPEVAGITFHAAQR